MPGHPRTKAQASIPARAAPVGVVVFCAGLALAGLALLAVGVVRGLLAATAAFVVVGVVIAAAVAAALAFGRGRVRLTPSLWELVPFWVAIALVGERLLGPTAGLAAALLYPAAMIGLRLVVPPSWSRAGSR